MTALLEARDLTFSYKRRGQPVLENLTAGFPPGSINAITGASGSGKSTLLYVVGLMIRPAVGGVWIDGNEVSRLSDGERSAWRARRIGFVFQDAVLDVARTVIDNVIEGGFYSGHNERDLRGRAARLLEAAEVDVRFDRRPGEISGGQAQRVALCRALVKQPDIILADEPTGNLDQASGQVVWTMLRQAADDGACIVLATHDLALAGQCDGRVTL